MDSRVESNGCCYNNFSCWLIRLGDDSFSCEVDVAFGHFSSRFSHATHEEVESRKVKSVVCKSQVQRADTIPMTKNDTITAHEHDS